MSQALAIPYANVVPEKRLRLYAVFHLNLAYSSIEEDQRPEVIRRCYWPLLNLIEELGLPFGIEASGFTLEEIARLDPSWIARFRRLLHNDGCEFIGSGYCQIIGPLVPARINELNQRFGRETYRRILKTEPDIALVNEQAYSSGLLAHYRKSNYRALIADWDNPAHNHPEWKPEMRYLPQTACGDEGQEITLVWSKSIFFQKLQRYAHGDLELNEYLDYLCTHLSAEPRAVALYGNDVEIFDFRPGRYLTEAELVSEGEWNRLRQLFEVLGADPHFEFLAPSKVAEMIAQPGGGQKLKLESAEHPIPVKKQGKYNVSRWAVTGRNDLELNSACWRIFKAFQQGREKSDEAWKKLITFWSSDFRTHITETRWQSLQKELESFLEAPRRRTAADEPSPAALSPLRKTSVEERPGNRLVIDTGSTRISLNCRRGLAIDRLYFAELSEKPVVGTLHQGYYDDISFGADFFTGHTVFERPGKAKITDLNQVEPTVRDIGHAVEVSAVVPTFLEPVYKSIRIFKHRPGVELRTCLEWEQNEAGSFRIGQITLHPEFFDEETLVYRTHNGGWFLESFPLKAKTVDHGRAVSSCVSSSHGLGATEGIVDLVDNRGGIRVEIDQTLSALMPMMIYREVKPNFFCRLLFSARETDETSRPDPREKFHLQSRITISPLA